MEYGRLWRARRPTALPRCEIVDSGSDAEYDELTKIAAQICQTPIALITLIDSERQWFKSRIGMQATETPREQAFCAFAIRDTATMIVRDALQDPRFMDNVLVLGEPRIRSYAGAPLQTGDGISPGTLCVIDREKRPLTAQRQAGCAADRKAAKKFSAALGGLLHDAD